MKKRQLMQSDLCKDGGTGMAYYDKKVIYLSEMEYGNKIKGAGFVRMECRGESCSFDMHVSGLAAQAEKKYDIFVVSAEGKEYPAGRIFLHKGSGEWKEVFDRDRAGFGCREIAEIRVRVSETKLLVGKLPLKGKTVQAAERKETAAGTREESVRRDIGKSRGIWKFVRGGSGQADTENSRRGSLAEYGEENSGRRMVQAEGSRGNGSEVQNLSADNRKGGRKPEISAADSTGSRTDVKVLAGDSRGSAGEARILDSRGDGAGTQALAAGNREEDAETRDLVSNELDGGIWEFASDNRGDGAGTRNLTADNRGTGMGMREFAEDNRGTGMETQDLGTDGREGGGEPGRPIADHGEIGGGTAALAGEGRRDNSKGMGIWGERGSGYAWTGDDGKAEQPNSKAEGRRKRVWGSSTDRAGIRKNINIEETEPENRAGKRQSGKGIEKGKGKEEKVQIEDVILNDKWEQLKQIYSVVHPYEDERQYIAIQPKDFVIMTGDYQHLANNSFLLHGFYNYRHIVLGREPDGSFYLGVPGVYYEREKMVALMFGFEAFECDGGRAEAGKFGYYLRKVKI